MNKITITILNRILKELKTLDRKCYGDNEKYEDGLLIRRVCNELDAIIHGMKEQDRLMSDLFTAKYEK